ncbi:hypothetical protein IRZ83_14345 [Flavobacterium sp. JLP]|uniref:hypothetical protein n=1 Tax=unclassified Flavobacterium TaxID=196869 RepID=UPI0004930E15|nr:MULTISPECIES: hypothetical protein [unclassified Flavobacterium]MBF4494768.1 hypothetical protein [Flavobacterium sp. MR2016-29]MBF4507853.1 hypothetical protein [Flavobacterium sp. JLP]
MAANVSGFNLNNLLDDATAAPTSPVSIAEYMSYEKHIQEIKNSDQNMVERKNYAEYIFSFTCLWCIAILFILIWKGMGKLNLSDEIIITLIGSSTVNVFVFFRLVTKYLFNEAKST